jgi:hypothetical protein
LVYRPHLRDHHACGVVIPLLVESLLSKAGWDKEDTSSFAFVLQSYSAEELLRKASEDTSSSLKWEAFKSGFNQKKHESAGLI